MSRLAKFLLPFALAGGLFAIQSAAAEETVVNPLRPKAGENRRAHPPATTEEKSAAAAKPKRERSAKQRQGDDMMRACGAEWRAEKASLKAKGETWRSFLKDCRAKKRAETPV